MNNDKFDCSMLFITADTREQSNVKHPKKLDYIDDRWGIPAYKTRIISLFEFFEEMGAICEYAPLTRGDYRIEGEFRGKEIDIGIEFKTMEDFANSYRDLFHKLHESYEFYEDVGLIVQQGPYDLSEYSSTDCVIHNPKVREGAGDVLPLSVYKNAIRTFEREGIYTERIQSEFEFRYAVFGMLIYLTRTVHKGLTLKGKSYAEQYLNVLTKIDGVGPKNAYKMAKHFPDLSLVGQYCEHEFQKVLGKKTGSKVYSFVRYYGSCDREEAMAQFDIAELKQLGEVA